MLSEVQTTSHSELEDMGSDYCRNWLDSRIRLGRNKMFTEITEIGPRLAEVMLERNNCNRPMRQGRSTLWAETIKRGDWKVTSQGLSFSKDGILTNGQHRLHGVVESGCTIKALVCFGEPNDAFTVIDTASKRSVSDALSICGFKHTTSLGATAKMLMNIRRGYPTANHNPSSDDILEFVGQNPDIHECVATGHRIYQKLRCNGTAIAAACFLIRQNSEHAAKLPEFIDRLFDGALPHARHPILVLRDGLLQRTIGANVRGAASYNAHLGAAIILAWNKFVRGTLCNYGGLNWSPEKAYPKPL